MVKNLPAMHKMPVRSLGWEDSLEKGMAAHSSILTWRIPLTELPGGLQSRGSRVGHNLATTITTKRNYMSVIQSCIPSTQPTHHTCSRNNPHSFNRSALNTDSVTGYLQGSEDIVMNNTDQVHTSVGLPLEWKKQATNK